MIGPLEIAILAFVDPAGDLRRLLHQAAARTSAGRRARAPGSAARRPRSWPASLSEKADGIDSKSIANTAGKGLREAKELKEADHRPVAGQVVEARDPGEEARTRAARGPSLIARLRPTRRARAVRIRCHAHAGVQRPHGPRSTGTPDAQRSCLLDDRDLALHERVDRADRRSSFVPGFAETVAGLLLVLLPRVPAVTRGDRG